MHCIIKEGREKMRDLNIITVSGTVNREPAYKENKENPNRTILYYSIEIYTGRDYYPNKEKKQLVHEKIYLNCVNYGKTAMELVNKVKKDLMCKFQESLDQIIMTEKMEKCMGFKSWPIHVFQ